MGNMEPRTISISMSSFIRGAVVVALTYAAWQISEFILALIAAVVIASAIEPLVLWAGRRRIPRVPAVATIFIGTALLFVGLFYFLILPLIGDMYGLVKTLTVYSNTMLEGGVLSNLFETQNVFGGFDMPLILSELSTYLNDLAVFLSQGFFSSLSAVFGGVVSFFLIIVISFYLAAQEDGVGKFLRMIVPMKKEEYVTRLWQRSQRKIGLWMQGQLLSSLLVAVLVYIGLLIVGVPYALLLAVLAGLFELIPLFGATLAAIPTIFVALTWGGLTAALVVGAIYVVIQQLEGNVIYPIVVNKVVGIPPVISIMALVVGGTLGGFLGVLVSVPVAAAILEFFADMEERKLAVAETHLS